MSLRFLADQCVPSEISSFLRACGYEVILLREVLPIRAPDHEVIAAAQARSAILLSLNGDFSDIVTYPPAEYCGIFSIQLHNHPEVIELVLRNVRSFLQAHPDPVFYSGKLFIVEAHRIRIRT